MVELRPAEHAGPPSPKSVASWWVWRLEDMKFVGHAGLSHVEGPVFWAGFYFRSGNRVEGGYGAEVLRLVCRFAVGVHGATKVMTTVHDLARRAAAEEAGFKLVESHPPQRAKRWQSHGWLNLAWEPK
jgi:RimJ/RimL family protein N-acetyltransferase